MPQINRVEKLIINLDMQMPLSCAWTDCEKPARTPYQVKTCNHPLNIKCSDPYNGHHSSYGFCSDNCRNYWLGSSGRNAHETAARNGGRIMGMAPAGQKLGRYR